MEKIVFLDRGTVKAPIPRPAFSHEWAEYESTPPESTVERLRGATIALTNKVPVREEHLAALPELRFIAVTATGYNVIDVEACRRRGVRVSNVPGYAREAVAEHVLMMMLALRRRLTDYHEAVCAGHWQRSAHFALLDHPISDLRGAVLGLIGYGDIAREVGRLALAFGMRILIADRKGASRLREGRTAFGSVLAEADIVSLHCPLTPETRDLIGAAELGRMKQGAILINTARGGIVNEAALAESLRKGHLGGAGIDVLTDEPPRRGNPLLVPGLRNLIVTPHVAWASEEAVRRMVGVVIANIEAFVNGKPQNLVA